MRFCNHFVILTIVFLVFLVSFANAADPALRAWYKFDETSGIDVADSSGNGFNTVITADTTPNWNPYGAIGGSLEGDGQWTGMCIDVPAAVFSTMSTQATFSWWTQHTENTTGGAFFTGSNGTENVLKSGPYSSAPSYYQTWSAGSATTNWWWGYSGAVDVDEWHHMAIVFDTADGTKKLYSNGEVVQTVAIAAGESLAGVNAFRLFSRSTTANAAWDVFKGKMDDVQIYDNALSQEEVAALVPEPATIALLGLGALTLIRRKK